jgi:hypothetical protein
MGKGRGGAWYMAAIASRLAENARGRFDREYGQRKN